MTVTVSAKPTEAGIMRINEKTLINFASCSSPVDKEGYLYKRGEINRGYQKRWFVLKANMLFYFEKRSDKEPIGVVILEGCTVELSENTGQELYGFQIVFQGQGSRTYVMASETQEGMEAWMKAITCAGYEYMKLMVSELQTQLDELSTENNMGLVTGGRGQPTSISQIASPSGLVDVSLNSSRSVTPSERFNPFNTPGSQDSDMSDPFGTPPFNPLPSSASNFTTISTAESKSTKSSQSSSKSSARSFDEMHEEFGHYIKKKLQENKGSPTGELISTA